MHRPTLRLATGEDLLYLSREEMEKFNAWIETEVSKSVEEEGEVLGEERRGEKLGRDGVPEAKEEWAIKVCTTVAVAAAAAAAAAAVDEAGLVKQLWQAGEEKG